jgi:hypothetical protein
MADVPMVQTLRAPQHIITVIATKQGQCMRLTQAMEPGKTENLAGTFIASGLIDDRTRAQPIGKSSRSVMVIFRDQGDRILELDRMAGFHLFKKSVQFSFHGQMVF